MVAPYSSSPSPAEPTETKCPAKGGCLNGLDLKGAYEADLQALGRVYTTVVEGIHWVRDQTTHAEGSINCKGVNAKVYYDKDDTKPEGHQHKVGAEAEVAVSPKNNLDECKVGGKWEAQW
jgi:hypothetical protein